MSDQVYRTLARKLDSIPPGFPSAESGVELRMLSSCYHAQEDDAMSWLPGEMTG